MFPSALKWAVPCSLLTLLLRVAFALTGYLPWDEVRESPTNVETAAFSLFMSIFGFLVVFRSQMAYSRFWQALTLVVQARGEWLNAAANLTAFCTASPLKKAEVRGFRHLLMSLLSMLFCASLTEISTVPEAYFQVLTVGIDEQSLQYLASKPEKREILMQWIQQLVVDCSRSGVVDIPAPILSRVFHELSIGNVNFNTAKTFSDVPFPFPFAQMVWVMISFFSLIPAPSICSQYLPPASGVVTTFLCVSIFWCIHFIAVEIESPFDDDANDLPLADIQVGFNKSLAILVEDPLHSPPKLADTAKLVLQEALVSLRPSMSINEVPVCFDTTITGQMKLNAEGLGPQSNAPRTGTSGGLHEAEVELEVDDPAGARQSLTARRSQSRSRLCFAACGTPPTHGSLPR